MIIEKDGFNNSLAGYINCPNAEKDPAPQEASKRWQEIYLKDGKRAPGPIYVLHVLTEALATKRFQGMVHGYNWTVADTYAAQMMCPYETVSASPGPSGVRV